MRALSRLACLGLLVHGLGGCSDGERGRGAPVERASPASTAASAESVTELERRIDALVVELDMLKSELARLRSERTSLVPAGALATPVDAPEGERAPLWYLQQYAASFAGGGEGSEYFRLAVQAYALELLGEIGTLVLDGRSYPALRRNLVALLGDARFRENAQAVGICLRLLTARGADEAVLAGLGTLKKIGTADSASALEGVLWSIESVSNRREAIDVLVALAGEGANAALARLWSRSLDDDERAFLVSRAVPNEAAGSLALFEQASHASQPVRLAAAQASGAFRFPEFEPFLDGWIQRESDEQVLAALGAARKSLHEKPNWSALQACGPPDAQPANDDPKAWASASADMGEQWLELDYDPPRRASGLAIHEVCVPGALVAVLATDTRGGRHELWRGVDPTVTPGVFELWFAPTSYEVRSIRLVLDTNRRAGWSEIDAVELIGPDGRAWASNGRASSSFGANRRGAASTFEELIFSGR